VVPSGYHYDLDFLSDGGWLDMVDDSDEGVSFVNGSITTRHETYVIGWDPRLDQVLPHTFTDQASSSARGGCDEDS
jgi:hypothetical protein